MRLISGAPAEGPVPRNVVEATTTRLREAVAVLEAIDEGHLLAELPPGPAGRRHQCAVSLLAVLERELRAIIAAQEEALDRPPACRRIVEPVG